MTGSIANTSTDEGAAPALQGSGASIKAVVFDVYGTLVQIHDIRRPYRQLLALLEGQGRSPQPDDAARLMSTSADLAGTAALLGLPQPRDLLAKLEQDLTAELASVRLMPGALTTIRALQDAGIRVGLCSNLASPYAAPAKQLLPSLDAYAWSFEAGAIKPDPKIYAFVCDALQVPPAQVLMVGDTMLADYEGPLAFGMQACHLAMDRRSTASTSIGRLAELPALLGLPK